MERNPKEYWGGAHEKYAVAEWINKPTMFAESVVDHFPNEGKILDAGCGQGQDSRFFASRGYDVIGIDFAAEGIQKAIEKAPPELNTHLEFREADLTEQLPFRDSEFDVVHSHLASHYFSAKETQELIKEFTRVLKPGGILTLLLNSVHDSEYGKGERIEDDYFLIDGIKKRYFSADSLRQFLANFEVILLDEAGETYKDRAVGNSKLVQFVGRKK